MSEFYFQTATEIGDAVITAAHQIFHDCGVRDDFAIQGATVFGGTNRILFHPTRGFTADRSYCTEEFLKKFDALMNPVEDRPFTMGERTFTMTTGMDDVDVEVDVAYTKGDPGDRMNPPDPGEIYAYAVRLKTNLLEAVNASEYHIEKMEEEAQKDAEGVADAYGDYLYESRRDAEMGL